MNYLFLVSRSITITWAIICLFFVQHTKAAYAAAAGASCNCTTITASDTATFTTIKIC